MTYLRLQKKVLHLDGEHIACEVALAETNVVILHGAGGAEKSRYYPFAEELIRRGLGVILFDFSGHGESSGELSRLTFAKRRRQASVVIDHFVPRGKVFYLVGFSMSGQTVCDLLPLYDKRVKAILLGCPGIYRNDIDTIPFGSTLFTAKIREENSWRNSTTSANLRRFKNKVIIAIGADDNVIPSAVIDLLRASAGQAEYKEYDGVGHQLAKWLGEHPKELAALLNELTNGGD